MCVQFHTQIICWTHRHVHKHVQTRTNIVLHNRSGHYTKLVVSNTASDSARPSATACATTASQRSQTAASYSPVGGGLSLAIAARCTCAQDPRCCSRVTADIQLR